MADDIGRWERKLREALGKESGTDSTGLQVAELQPNRKKNEVFQLAGDDTGIINQVSLFLALYEYHEARSQGNIDFDKWAQDFCDCFPSLKEGMNKAINNRNSKPWGVDKKDKPLINRLTDLRTKPNYITVEFFPRRTNLNEVYFISGTSSDVIAQISSKMAMWMMLQNYDIGSIVAMDLFQAIRNKPRSGIQIILTFTTNQQPPFNKDPLGGFFSKNEVKIPLVDKSKITYNNLRTVCGGDQGLQWGDRRCTLSLTNSNGDAYHQLWAFGNTDTQAYNNAISLLSLSNAVVTNVSYGGVDWTKGQRAKRKFSANQKSFKVYPAFVSVVNSKIVAMEDTRIGKETNAGKQLRKGAKKFLYYPTAPSTWDAEMAELLKDSGFK